MRRVQCERALLALQIPCRTVGLNAIELSAYRRVRGLFPEQVSRWRQTALDANQMPVLSLL